jgi:3-oxoacyl-[acyl-carrier-protein] synthase-3
VTNGDGPDIFIAGLGVEVPEPRPIDDPPLQGTGMSSVACSDLPAHELATRAGRRALDDAGTDPLTVDRLFYSFSFDPTAPFWAPASSVADGLGVAGPAVRVDQVSNSGMAALQLAVELLSGPCAQTVLVTTGERHVADSVDRWHSDPGTVFGDGGTAVVLGHQGGPALVRAVRTVSDPWLEGMHRPPDGEPVPDRVDLGGHKRTFLAERGTGETLRRLAHGQTAAIDRTLEEAGVTLDQVDWFVIPHLGRKRLQSALLGPFEIPVERTTWEWGNTVGHLGPGDQLFGLQRLLASGRTAPGDLVLLLGIGSGFSWSCALLEVTG